MGRRDDLISGMVGWAGVLTYALVWDGIAFLLPRDVEQLSPAARRHRRLFLGVLLVLAWHVAR